LNRFAAVFAIISVLHTDRLTGTITIPTVLFAADQCVLRDLNAVVRLQVLPLLFTMSPSVSRDNCGFLYFPLWLQPPPC
jgi:hypothetical protein